MERQEATALVAELLDSGHTREEAVQALCKRTGYLITGAAMLLGGLAGTRRAVVATQR